MSQCADDLRVLISVHVYDSQWLIIIVYNYTNFTSTFILIGVIFTSLHCHILCIRMYTSNIVYIPRDVWLQYHAPRQSVASHRSDDVSRRDRRPASDERADVAAVTPPPSALSSERHWWASDVRECSDKSTLRRGCQRSSSDWRGEKTRRTSMMLPLLHSVWFGL